MDDAGFLDVPVATDDRRFDGHFPGDPMLPGACLLDLVIDALERARVLPPASAAQPRGVPVAKFLAPVRPGDVVRIGWRRVAGGLRFDCRVGERPVATGSLR